MVADVTIAENTNHGAMAAVSQTTNGTSFMGLALKPTLKTNQKTRIITAGWIKVQKKPRNEPTYMLATSRRARARSISLYWIRSFANRTTPPPITHPPTSK